MYLTYFYVYIIIELEIKIIFYIIGGEFMQKIDFSDAPSSVQKFLEYLIVSKGRSPNTVFQYYHDLRTFFRYMLKVRHPGKYKDYAEGDLSFNEVNNKLVFSVNAGEILSFLSYCTTEKANAPSARNRKLSCLRSLYKYLCKTEKLIDKDPTEFLEGTKRPKRLPKYLDIDESRELLESVKGANYERDYAIITLFLNLGLRVSELCGINLKDINKNFETIRIIGKGNKERIIYLNDACEAALKAYLDVRPTNVRQEAENALFISRNRNRISKQTVQWLVYKHLQEAGLDRPGMSVHKLRHTAATLMYQHGHTDVRILKDILGHEDLSTTEIYTHISDEQMKNAAESNPLSGLKPNKKRLELKDIQDKNEDNA